jgi:uncharacterized membrane protein YgdD (TMEM256/DUF423 family)
MTGRWIRVAGSVTMAMGVVLGAYGAHGLNAPAERMATWNTAVLYHLVHGLALLAVGIGPRTGRLFAIAAVALSVGLLLFCGSLYLLVITGVTGLGAVTPLGGLAFVAAWLVLAIGFATMADENVKA